MWPDILTYPSDSQCPSFSKTMRHVDLALREFSLHTVLSPQRHGLRHKVPFYYTSSYQLSVILVYVPRCSFHHLGIYSIWSLPPHKMASVFEHSHSFRWQKNVNCGVHTTLQTGVSVPATAHIWGHLPLCSGGLSRALEGVSSHP